MSKIASLLPNLTGVGMNTTLGELFERTYTKYPRRLIYPVIAWTGICYYYFWNPYAKQSDKDKLKERMEYLKTWYYLYRKQHPRSLEIVLKPSTEISPDIAKRESVVAAFRHAWSGYKKYAWGYDELHPISATASTWFQLGLTIIDSLDTSYLMEQFDIYKEARNWVESDLKFNYDGNSNVFEITIRVLGGLLATYNLTGDAIMLEKSKQLADILLLAFETKSEIPLASINMKDKIGVAAHFNSGASSTAEVTTLQLEFKYLAHLTKDSLYWNRVQKVMEKVLALKPQAGLVPVFISPINGQFYGNEIRLGSRGDSYYEYLAKQWIQTNFTEIAYEREYKRALSGIRKHLLGKSSPNGFLFVGERPEGIDRHFSTKMDHLVCFLPGTIALVASKGKRLTKQQISELQKQDKRDLELAEELVASCYEMYYQTLLHLSPEIVFWNEERNEKSNEMDILEYHKSDDIQQWSKFTGNVDPDTRFNLSPDRRELDFSIHQMDGHNLLRPETIESIFILYRITGKQKYRDWGWNIFLAFEKHAKVANGYSSIADVRNEKVEYRDKMETFFLGETLKYFYLLFDTKVDLESKVFNTEAHPLPIFEPDKDWKKKLLYLE